LCGDDETNSGLATPAEQPAEAPGGNPVEGDVGLVDQQPGEPVDPSLDPAGVQSISDRTHQCVGRGGVQTARVQDRRFGTGQTGPTPLGVEHVPRDREPEVIGRRLAGGGVDPGVLDKVDHLRERIRTLGDPPDECPGAALGREPEHLTPRRGIDRTGGHLRGVDQPCRNGVGLDRVLQSGEHAYGVDDDRRDAVDASEFLGQYPEGVRLAVTALADDERGVGVVEVQPQASAVAAVGCAVCAQHARRSTDGRRPSHDPRLPDWIDAAVPRFSSVKLDVGSRGPCGLR
jgi:hypothetical protein